MNLVPDQMLTDVSVAFPFSAGGKLSRLATITTTHFHGGRIAKSQPVAPCAATVWRLQLVQPIQMKLWRQAPVALSMCSGTAWIEIAGRMPRKIPAGCDVLLVGSPNRPLTVYFGAGLHELSASLDLSVRGKIADRGLPAGQRAAVGRARRFIESKCAESLPLHLVARKVALNVETLRVSFKMVYGRTVHQYQMYCRVKKAYQLLRKGLAVHVVARRCGYRNVSHFTLVFRRITGKLPAACRRM